MRLRSAGRIAAVVLSALIVAACSSLPRGALDRTMHGHTIEGRLSLRYRELASGKEEGSTGRFVWTMRGDELELSLLDPLGQTVALIRSDARHSSIVFRDGRKFDGATPEALTQETLGWTVPLRGLGFWLDGRTDPATPFTVLADGRFQQNDWTIGFPSDADRTGGAPPKRIDLSYPGPPTSIEMRVVVDQRSDS